MSPGRSQGEDKYYCRWRISRVVVACHLIAATSPASCSSQSYHAGIFLCVGRQARYRLDAGGRLVETEVSLESGNREMGKIQRNRREGRKAEARAKFGICGSWDVGTRMWELR